jgi:hypothetical protein
MCGGVKYTDKSGKDWTIYFSSWKAALPVQSFLEKDLERNPPWLDVPPGEVIKGL